MRIQFLFLFLILTLLSCSQKEKADLLVYNATIYTVDSAFSMAEAMAIKDGKILAIGKTTELEKKYEAKERTDAQGKLIYPGFIDAHAHFVGYGLGLQTADLVGTKSWEEIIEKLKTFSAENKDGWLIGRGWDQNDWTVKDFPTNEKLNELFPDRPVLLTRIDGHAAIANQKALDEARIKPGQQMTGGEAEVTNGKLTGLLIDNAVDLVTLKIPVSSKEHFRQALLEAQKNCFAAGLTTIDDCGLSH